MVRILLAQNSAPIRNYLFCDAGGRQVDGAIPSLLALANIMESLVVLEAQKAGRFTVLFDSGIRSGSDIIKAIALGAQGVLRMYYLSISQPALF
jgi:lactate 2-monooxygenase